MPPRHLVRRLAEEIRSVEQAAKGTDRQPHFSTGIPPLDRLLPDGGLCRGMLIEWLPAAGHADGGTTLWALLTARAACRTGEGEMCPLVVVDRHGTFYPPAAIGWGVPLASMILVRPTTARDEAWALDQAVRSPAVAAVLAWPSRLDGRAFRRLQLAVESSGAVGVFVRPPTAKNEPTWADVRLSVGPVRRTGPGAPVGPLCQSGPDGTGESPPATVRVPTARSGSANRTYSGGWRFSLQCLHARASVQVGDAVEIEITPDGRVHEIASKAARNLGYPLGAAI
jgi:protein ImuA